MIDICIPNLMHQSIERNKQHILTHFLISKSENLRKRGKLQENLGNKILGLINFA